jgi:hypothetical protein
MKLSFVKWPKYGLWHIERADGHTVCGLLVEPIVVREHRPANASVRRCKTCDRMKDASSVILARGQ